MHDLIERQAAIDAFLTELTKRERKNLLHTWSTVEVKYFITKMLEQMSPAQPETHDKRTETHSCDSISRKEAIDALDNLEWFHQNANKDMVSGANSAEHQAWYKAEDVYRVLDEVYAHAETEAEARFHSEIVRCKYCKHFEYDHPYIIQGVPVLGHEVCNAWGNGCKTDENGYCFLAERRTDDTD